MRIKKFETNGFGCLKGSYEFGSLPATLIIEKNERGKSTLVCTGFKKKSVLDP
jgi:hypothetical protein